MKFALVVCFAALAAAEQRPRLTLRLIPGIPMVMVPIPMPMEDTGHTATAILMSTATTERDLLMPSPRLRLMPSSIDTVPIIPMLTLDSTTATLDTTLDTLMPTMERGPPMLSPRLMPMPTTDITDMALGPTTV